VPSGHRAEDLPEVRRESWPPEPFTTFGLTVPGDRPEGVVAFTGGRVITMRGEEVIEQGTVVVKANRLVAVGPIDEVEIPTGAYVVDTRGKTVMPGLVDMHGHIDCCYYDGPMPQKHPSQYAAAAAVCHGLHRELRVHPVGIPRDRSGWESDHRSLIVKLGPVAGVSSNQRAVTVLVSV
jgi:hypothetical protein